ncbi:uncharacterized protein SCDLUD_002589 [Saccharomycodes ludwigii]|uniref:uncharacterized protein n=1 Tax=Saccharomycodes ludwigii TaxID=36035 RepID=UPI001E886CD0|nr:hypothetical protein SCDLUD_002589 [Saccharomycodes ludwigii]KAH3901111.1 hypothetical protein SCDLUD_002589 [Saccharomycodes ludwigii]
MKFYTLISIFFLQSCVINALDFAASGWNATSTSRSVLVPSSSTGSASSSSSTASVCSPTAVCPNDNFNWHAQQLGYDRYYLEITDIEWEYSNVYEISIHVYSKTTEPITLSDLWELKIIGLNSPDESTVVLFSHNENVYKIDNPIDWTASFRVYTSDSGCISTMPNFQIQYDYSYVPKGPGSFDLSVGCNADNMGNSQTDFPSYEWSKECSANCIA